MKPRPSPSDIEAALPSFSAKLGALHDSLDPADQAVLAEMVRLSVERVSEISAGALDGVVGGMTSSADVYAKPQSIVVIPTHSAFSRNLLAAIEDKS